MGADARAQGLCDDVPDANALTKRDEDSAPVTEGVTYRNIGAAATLPPVIRTPEAQEEFEARLAERLPKSVRRRSSIRGRR